MKIAIIERGKTYICENLDELFNLAKLLDDKDMSYSTNVASPISLTVL